VRKVSYALVAFMVVWFGACGTGEPEPQAPDQGPARCVTGQAIACQCNNGDQGSQICNSDGEYDRCDCAGDVDMTSDAPPDIDMAEDCSSACAARVCGLAGGGCEQSCGECQEGEICSEEGVCGTPDNFVSVEIEQQQVDVATKISSALYEIEIDRLTLVFDRELFEIQISNVSQLTPPWRLTCADEPWPDAFANVSLQATTIPLGWRGTSWVARDCDNEFIADEVRTWDLTLTDVSATHVAGTFRGVVAGKEGNRAGQFAIIESRFDVALFQQ